MKISSVPREIEDQLLEDRIAQFRQLTFSQVAALPATRDEETLVGGSRCTVTVYVQPQLANQLLLVVRLFAEAFSVWARYIESAGLASRRMAPFARQHQPSSSPLEGSGMSRPDAQHCGEPVSADRSARSAVAVPGSSRQFSARLR